MTEKKRPLVILTGPTSVGKTALSIKLAKAINGQIISADSMQVYRGMDIGSAKITAEEMQGVKHHLIDICSPLDDFNVAIFKTLCEEAIEKIYSEGMVPIIVGGTGFYIQAVLKGIDFADNEEDNGLRRELEELSINKGAEYLHEELRKVDPESADIIHANNVKRVIRALEFYKLTGRKISEHNEEEKAKESIYDSYYFVLNDERARIYDRIEQRIDIMMEQGLVEEVKKLKDLGCKRGMTSMQGLGYKEILDYLDGTLTLDEAVTILKRDTRHFAKRQLTWFNREKDIIWLNKNEFDYDEDSILEYMLDKLRFLKNY